MKTPWRFLADLISPKSRVDQAAIAGGNAEMKALEYFPVEVPVESSHEEGGSVVPPTADDSPVGALQDATEVPATHTAADSFHHTATDELMSSAAYPDEVIVGAASLARAGQQDPVKDDVHLSSPKKMVSAETSVLQPVALDQRSSQASAGNVPPKELTFSERMLISNAEIQELRKQLAGKLMTQNEQLRGLLRRYDRD
ncbi:hypothetical protein [Neorhizobium sp. DAR64872/K0K18]|uniref:hypothetical protein n=1 Tax=Neorhizobium sp. DAR64872/K0K18 TaxID=3421958 RepID=UPI003D2A37A7